MLAFSATAILEAESAVMRDMLLMLVVLERLQLVVGFLGVDNWDCGVRSRLVGRNRLENGCCPLWLCGLVDRPTLQPQEQALEQIC